MEEPKKTVVMRKGDTYADIFDSPETIAQARRDGYSLVDPEDIEKHGDDLESLTKNELLELVKQKGVFEKKHSTWNKPELVALLRPDGPDNQGDEGKPPEGTDPPTRAELIQSAIAKGLDESSLNSLSDDEIAALLEPEE